MKHLYTLLLLSFFITQGFAQGPAHFRCQNFRKGMNLSNWLEATWQNGWPTANGYTHDDLVKMKEAGITSIRLPICFEEITDTLAPYTVDVNHPLFARIDTVISWCIDLQMAMIIDNHHQWNIVNQNWRAQTDRFAHLWSVVAQRYSYLNTEQFTFELLNEPAFGIHIDSMNMVFNQAIDTIRKYAPNHSLIVGPNFSSTGQAFANLTPLPDTNLIYTFHCYDPYQFTHQGFSWAQPAMPLGTSFPSSFDAMLHNAWKQVVLWKQTYNKPVFLGEFGAGVFGDDASRCRWMQYMGAKIDSFNIPWFYWDWRWDFSLFNSNTISADSVVPCFRSALHLYGDSSTYNGIINVSENELPVTLYPNPSNGGVCEVRCALNKEATLTVYDAAGRKLREEKFQQQYLLPTENLQRGLYFIRIVVNDKAVVKKLVVE